MPWIPSCHGADRQELKYLIDTAHGLGIQAGCPRVICHAYRGPTWSNGQSRGKSPDVQRNRCLTLDTPSIFFGVGDFFDIFDGSAGSAAICLWKIPDGHLPGTNGLGPRPRLLQHLRWHRTVPGENFGGNWPQNDAMGIGGFYHSLPMGNMFRNLNTTAYQLHLFWSCNSGQPNWQFSRWGK